jgi:exonuclease III
MKFISWNVNGLRACVTKGFENFFNDIDADIFCLQETKLQEGQIDLHPMDIIVIGIMLKRRDILVLQYLVKSNLCL